MKTNYLILCVLCLSLSLTSCTDEPVDDGTNPTGTPEGKADNISKKHAHFNFAFRKDSARSFRVQTDHLGVSLLATGVLDRSDTYSCDGVNNKTDLLKIYKGLVHLHREWGDDIERMGFETCDIGHIRNHQPGDDTDLLDFLRAVPCTTQKYFRRLPNGKRVGGQRVIDLITPDYAMVDVDEPAGFPNGRVLHDSISDLFFALGLVDLDAVGDASKVRFNPTHNDVPFRTRFPYLADAHKDIPQ